MFDSTSVPSFPCRSSISPSPVPCRSLIPPSPVLCYYPVTPVQWFLPLTRTFLSPASPAVKPPCALSVLTGTAVWEWWSWGCSSLLWKWSERKEWGGGEDSTTGLREGPAGGQHAISCSHLLKYLYFFLKSHINNCSWNTLFNLRCPVLRAMVGREINHWSDCIVGRQLLFKRV